MPTLSGAHAPVITGPPGNLLISLKQCFFYTAHCTNSMQPLAKIARVAQVCNARRAEVPLGWQIAAFQKEVLDSRRHAAQLSEDLEDPKNRSR
jgi:hypothetical protein